jgi:cellulose synthase (UDP-forming)
VLVIDAGDTIAPNVMEFVLPHMGEERLGFLQVERHFYFRDKPLPQDYVEFYQVIVPRRDRVGSIFACGSGAFWKLEALDELGGFSTWNLVEDLTTSYLLQIKGWHGKYIYGTPLHWAEYVPDLAILTRQRWQWIVDTYRLFFWRNPFRQKSLSWVLKWDYAEIALMYLLSIPIVVIRAIPWVLIVWPVFLFDDQQGGLTYWQFFLPVMGLRLLCERIELGLAGVPFSNWISQQGLYEGLVPMFVTAAIQTFSRGPEWKPPYRPTGIRRRGGFFWMAIRLQLLWFFGGVVTVWYGYMMDPVTPMLVISTFWLLYSLWLLIPFVSSAAATSFWMFRIFWRGVVTGSFLCGVVALLLELDTYGAFEVFYRILP